MVGVKEMSGFEVYLILHLIPAVGNVCEFLAVVAGVVSAVVLVVVVVCIPETEKDKEDLKCFKCILKCAIIGLILFGMLATIIPSRNTLIAIYTVPFITQNKELQELPANINKALESVATDAEKSE